jgi:hypothetical protein
MSQKIFILSLQAMEGINSSNLSDHNRAVQEYIEVMRAKIKE